MIKSLSQSLVAAAFLGTGLMSGMDTRTDASDAASGLTGLIHVQPTVRDDAAPGRIARRR